MADAGLFRIPAATIDGVTYFGAVRVIDNNAAVDLRTALSRDADFLAGGAAVSTHSNPVAGAFTAHVGLAELLRSAPAAAAPDDETGGASQS